MTLTAIHWVTGIGPNRLGMMARPRGGASLREEVAAWSSASVAIIVSLLEPREVRELELDDEAALCIEHGIGFRHFPIADRGTPASVREFAILVAELHFMLAQGKAVAIHCHAGIGRTGLVAGCLLHSLKVPYGEIFPILSRSRGVTMPETTGQVQWLETYARAFPPAHHGADI